MDVISFIFYHVLTLLFLKNKMDSNPQGVLWFIQTGGARPDTAKVLLAKGDKRYSASVCVCLIVAGRGGRAPLGWSQLCCSGGGDSNNQHHWLLWMFALSSVLLWNALILQHRQPTYKAARAASEVNLSTAAEWQRTPIYVVSVNYLWLWPSRVCTFLLHLASRFMN